jgi:hypothetical protein
MQQIVTYGQRWVITFLSQKGDLTSLFVSTGSCHPSIIASEGSLFGRSAVVRVETISDGGLPTTFITLSILSSDDTYVAKVRASNGHTWDDTATLNAIRPCQTVPFPPGDVRMHPLSDSAIAVMFKPPLYSGRDDQISFKVQWGSNLLWDNGSASATRLRKQIHHH